MEAGSSAAGLWLSHLLSKVSTEQSPFVGVINWPRHPGLSSLLGWSSTILIPGWANLSLQAQWARQCRFAASILVTKWRGVSGWVFKWESEGKKIRTCCRRRYVPNTWWSIHFESNKDSFKGGGWGQRYLQGDTAKKSGIQKLIMQECLVWSPKRLSDGSVNLAGGSVATGETALYTPMSLLNQDVQRITPLFCLCVCFKTSQWLIFKTAITSDWSQ